MKPLDDADTMRNTEFLHNAELDIGPLASCWPGDEAGVCETVFFKRSSPSLHCLKLSTCPFLRHFDRPFSQSLLLSGLQSVRLGQIQTQLSSSAGSRE